MKNPIMNEAYSKLQVMSADEGNRRLYEARLKAQRDEYARIQGTRQDGWQNKAIEVARKLKNRGRSVGEIAEDTGLSLEEIAKL